jgi:cell division protein DivIC
MKTTLRILANKYVIATIIFLVMMLFFSPYDYFTMKAAKKELNDINEKIDYLNAEADRMNNELATLVADSITLEKYARQLYHQKKDGEDVYVIK